MAIAELPSREEILAEVHRYKWAHTIDLGDGIKTPGAWGDHNQLFWKAIHDVDFRGKKVLDIGCWDGLFSFEAEKRGAAEVYATDLVSDRSLNDQPTFQLAHRILNSRVKYDPKLSVYDVERLGIRDFDIVIYGGIFYHLRDPLGAFTALRRVMKDGALMVVEGEVVNSPHAYATFHYRNVYKHDRTNWWVPSSTCLREWVESCFFEISHDYGVTDKVNGHAARMVLTCKAIRKADPLLMFPIEGLSEFDLNNYPER